MGVPYGHMPPPPPYSYDIINETVDKVVVSVELEEKPFIAAKRQRWGKHGKQYSPKFKYSKIEDLKERDL